MLVYADNNEGEESLKVLIGTLENATTQKGTRNKQQEKKTIYVE